MGPVLLALAVFIAMEPITTVVHRIVMHGRGWGWHRSHHRPTTGRFEANDLYPVVFSALTIAVLCVGVFGGVGVLVPVGIGVTAYGAAYTLLHDVAIHRRLPIRTPGRLLDPWRRAHAVHHRWNGAPYGFLVPVVPRRLRDREESNPVAAEAVARPMGQARVR
ncbi:MAG: sterol desaturase family protein [Actinomycetes bacterium]